MLVRPHIEKQIGSSTLGLGEKRQELVIRPRVVSLDIEPFLADGIADLTGKVIALAFDCPPANEAWSCARLSRCAPISGWLAPVAPGDEAASRGESKAPLKPIAMLPIPIADTR